MAMAIHSSIKLAHFLYIPLFPGCCCFECDSVRPRSVLSSEAGLTRGREMRTKDGGWREDAHPDLGVCVTSVLIGNVQKALIKQDFSMN